MGVQKILKFSLFITLVVFAAFSSAIDTQNRMSSESVDITLITGPHTEVVEKSIDSAVRVISTMNYADDSAITSASSGTYFAHNNRTYVITAAHSLIGDCAGTMIVAGEYMFHCMDMAHLDHDRDIGIIEVENIFNKKPINIQDILYSENDIKNNTPVHEPLYYTGYPQGHGPFTFDGKIVSHRSENGLFFAHSYAWSGSSGSGVFNSHGKLVGIITAVSVANTEYGIDVMEDLIIITSTNLLDFQDVL